MDERNIPIDINLRKLLDWLISRRICNKQWHENIRLVREKIGTAIVDMPEHPKLKDLLSGAHINYWHCLEIVDLLKDTEKGTKNFFGQYGSQRMTLWKEIVSLYENDNIYLGEGSQLLTQAVTYELPGLKKHIAKLGQIQEECDRKEKENIKKANEFKNEYMKACQQLGIEGKHPRKEIIALLDDLPKIYATLTDDCKKLTKPIQYYRNFCSNEEELLATLSFLISRGNVTTYEWVHGEPPLVVEEPKIDLGEDPVDKEITEKHDEIDFDFDLSADIDLSQVQLEAPIEIDWGNLNEATDGSDDPVIDWDAVECAVELESDGVEGGIARDTDALTILDNRKTRNLILNDLHELESFMVQRQFELNDDSAISSVLLGPTLTGDVKVDDLAIMISDVRSIIQKLTTGKLHHLQLVKTSSNYVARLVENLTTKSKLSERLIGSNFCLATKKEDAIKEQNDARRNLNLMTTKCNELQQNIEKNISSRYQNRKVSITGGVQSI